MTLSTAIRGKLRSALANAAVADEIADLLTSLSGGIGGATFTIGTEDTNEIIVSIQILDARGDAVAEVVSVEVLLFDDAAGISFNTDDYTIAAGTDGALEQVVADKILMCTTEADGDLDISLTIIGAATTYLGIRLPDGRLVISDAVTHAA